MIFDGLKIIFIYNNGQNERLCLIIDKCRRQKLCKRAQKISAAAPLRVMASRYNPCEYRVARMAE
jgi:hypothetical protein